MEEKCLVLMSQWMTDVSPTALEDLHSKIVKLFQPWIFPVDTDDGR